MRRKVLLLGFIFLSSCSRGWKNPLESDEELKHQPAIEQIALDAQYNIVVYLSFGYSSESTITLERKTKGGFERISYVRLSQAALVDTSFDKEFDYNFAYRVRVEKNGYRTDYSAEKLFAYVSKILNAPKGLQTTTQELQGIKLEWIDRSGKETGFKIEKNAGSGYVEIASLSANSQSYFDAISGIPSSPLQLSYRIRAFNSTLSSQWVDIATSYSGIAVPTNLHITDTTNFRFTIEWKDNSSIETGYIIERKKNGGTFSEIAQLAANATRYPHRIDEIGAYTYRVRAKKDNVYSGYSNEASYMITFVGFAATWKMSEEFSVTNNPNKVWSYGRKWSAEGKTYDILTVGDGQGWWFGNWGHGAPNIRPGLNLWAKDNSNGLPAVRWTSPESGFYKLASTFTGADSRGVSVVVYIAVNDTVKFNGNIENNLGTANYSLDGFYLAQGNYIDFLIKWNGGVYSEYSWTGVDATINKY